LISDKSSLNWCFLKQINKGGYMEEINKNELIELYLSLSKCRECQLNDGYFPQLYPPGIDYKPGGVVFIQINPGYIGSMKDAEIAKKYKKEYNRNIACKKAQETRKLIILQEEFIKNPFEYTYNSFRDTTQRLMSELWGWPPGKYGRTIKDHGAQLASIAIINLAQCPVPDNKYQSILEKCWFEWTSKMLEILRPSTIVAQGEQVYNFLLKHKSQLPMGTELLKGIHHADRRSQEIKDEILSIVKKSIIC
jgi:hypothetical protein